MTIREQIQWYLDRLDDKKDAEVLRKILNAIDRIFLGLKP